MPAVQPPSAEATSVQVVIMPACWCVMSNATTIAGSAKVKIKKSRELRVQPTKQAHRVRFSFGSSRLYHAAGLSLLAIIRLPFGARFAVSLYYPFTASRTQARRDTFYLPQSEHAHP